MKHSEFPLRKGQAFISDFVIATLVFMIVLALIVFMWDEMLSRIDVLEDIGDMEWSSSNAVEQLMRSEGFPEDWYLDPENAEVIGLVDSGFFGESEDRVLDPDKVMHLINLTKNNYDTTRNKLLRRGDYNFYMNISCINASNRDCFDGLKIGRFSEGGVTCLNGFTLGAHGGYTDAYLWREAEAYDYEYGTTTGSSNEASNSTYMKLGANDELMYRLNIETPGYYKLLLRASNTGGAKDIDVDIGSDFYTIIVSDTGDLDNYVWVSAPDNVFLTSGLLEVNFSKGTNFVHVDAFILTTNVGYVPDNTAPYYGNFHLVEPTTCIIGNYTQQANSSEIVSRSGLATFSSGSNSTVRLGLVMWSGSATEIPVTTTVTTTIIPAGALICDIFTSNDGEVSSYCSGGAGEYTCVFSLWQPSNSHAGWCSYGSRDLCCKVPGEDLTVTASDGCNAGEGGVVSMTGASNSHVEEYGTGAYDSDICLEVGGGGEIQCAVYSNNCPAEGNWGEVGSMYSTSNSHAAQFSYYDNKICCNVTVMPTSTTTSTSTTSTSPTTSTTSTSTTTTTTIPVLSCSTKASCLGTEACIFTMYDTYTDDTAGAHGANCTGTGIYDNLVCCSASGCAPTCEVVGSPSSCSPGYERVISLYNGTDAHAQDPDGYNTYTNVICCSTGACGGTLSCGVTATSCDVGEETLASMASNDDSHLGGINTYSDKICCVINP